MGFHLIIIFSYFLLSVFYLESNHVLFFSPFFASLIPVLGSAFICAHKVIFLPPTPIFPISILLQSPKHAFYHLCLLSRICMFALKPFFLKSRSVTAQGWFWGPAGRITGKEERGWGTHFCVVFVSVAVFVNLQHIMR